MDTLVHIQKSKIGPDVINSVNARELHKSLGLKSDFSTWIKKEIELFEENKDYILLHKKMEQVSHGGNNKIEYLITFDTAKHLSMIQRNEKGKEVRD